MTAPVCWKCRGNGRYRVSRWMDFLEAYRIVWKNCDCSSQETQ